MKENTAYLILGLCIGIILTTWTLKIFPFLRNYYFKIKDFKRKNVYKIYEEIEEEN